MFCVGPHKDRKESQTHRVVRVDSGNGGGNGLTSEDLGYTKEVSSRFGVPYNGRTEDDCRPRDVSESPFFRCEGPPGDEGSSVGVPKSCPFLKRVPVSEMTWGPKGGCTTTYTSPPLLPPSPRRYTFRTLRPSLPIVRRLL